MVSLNIIAGILFAGLFLIAILIQIYLKKWEHYLKKQYPKEHQMFIGKSAGLLPWPFGVTNIKGFKALFLAYFTNKLNFDETLRRYSRVYKNLFLIFTIILILEVILVIYLQR